MSVITDKKVAISSYMGRVAPVFDTAQKFKVVLVKGDINFFDDEIDSFTFSSECPVTRALELLSMKLDVLICGAISRAYREVLQSYGIKVVSFISGDITSVINGYKKDMLNSSEFKMPGCSNLNSVVKGEVFMNKVAFSTSGSTLTAPLDQRFGRTENLLVYDLDKKTFEIIDNAVNMNAAQGAGIQTAQTVLKSGAASIVTGHCGPKAYRVLKSAGIKIHYCQEATVQEALEKFRAGLLTEASDADVEGHW